MDGELDHERAAASDRLRDAWKSGALDAAEHERRTRALRRATTVEDIRRAEYGTGTELRPLVSPIPPVPAQSGGHVAAEPSGEVVPRPRAGVPERWSSRVASAYPITAFLGFMVTGMVFGGWNVAWLWFVTIPIVMMVLGGDRHDEDDD